MSIAPGRAAPSLEVDTAAGGRFELSKQQPSAFSMVVFYRGLHCKTCRRYLKELHALRGAFAALGVDVIAVSMDTRERAERAVGDWELEGLRVGFGLLEQDALSWGLYISEGTGEEQPARFAEPGLFLVEPGGKVHYLAINSAAFGRPDLRALLSALKEFSEKPSPARGTAASP